MPVVTLSNAALKSDQFFLITVSFPAIVKPAQLINVC